MEKNEERLILTSDDDFVLETENDGPSYTSESVTPKKSKKKGGSTNSEEPQPWWKTLLEYVRVIAIGALVAFLLTRFVIINAIVPTGSMIPTIERGDRLFGFRPAYAFNDPKRGEVAIFVTPDPTAAEGELYIKRVIGLPGETLTICGSTITIQKTDGSVLILTPENEDYINPITYSQDYLNSAINNQVITLHYEGETDENGELLLDEDGNPYENEYFMMGDNRDNSNDSRKWGPVKRSAIKAKAGWKYFNGFAVIGAATYEE